MYMRLFINSNFLKAPNCVHLLLLLQETFACIAAVMPVHGQ